VQGMGLKTLILAWQLAVGGRKPDFSQSRLPSALDGYSLLRTESRSSSGAIEDAVYRNASGQDVYITVLHDQTRASNGARQPGTDAIEAATAYVDELRAEQRTGQIDFFNVAFDRPDSARTSDRLLIGRSLGVAIRRPTGLTVALFYVFELPNGSVTIGGSMPLAVWRQTDIPRFARDLALAVQS
jgi:hypothetical protein